MIKLSQTPLQWFVGLVTNMCRSSTILLPVLILQWPFHETPSAAGSFQHVARWTLGTSLLAAGRQFIYSVLKVWVTNSWASNALPTDQPTDRPAKFQLPSAPWASTPKSEGCGGNPGREDSCMGMRSHQRSNSTSWFTGVEPGLDNRSFCPPLPYPWSCWNLKGTNSGMVLQSLSRNRSMFNLWARSLD